ncbi:TPA: hypothetical protein ACNPBJ_001183 [Salmonella enterica subsp. enterica serovar Typhimurium]
MADPFFIGGGGKLAAEIGAMATDIKKTCRSRFKARVAVAGF